DALQQLAANLLVADIRKHVDILDHDIRLTFRKDFHPLLVIRRCMDIPHKLSVMLRHQEVIWEALQDGNIRLPTHGVEVAIDDVFLLPLALQGYHAIDVSGGACPNTNLLHRSTSLQARHRSHLRSPARYSAVPRPSGLDRSANIPASTTYSASQYSAPPPG